MAGVARGEWYATLLEGEGLSMHKTCLLSRFAETRRRDMLYFVEDLSNKPDNFLEREKTGGGL